MRISGAVRSGTGAISPNRYTVSGLAWTPASGITNDDKGAATIRTAARAQTAGVCQDLGGSRFAVTSAQTMRDFVQAVREKIAELMAMFKQLGSSDHFPVGASEGANPLSTAAEFRLDQVRSVEQRVAETNAQSELGVFSLARIREQAMKVLRSESFEPDRVLFLLRDP